MEKIIAGLLLVLGAVQVAAQTSDVVVEKPAIVAELPHDPSAYTEGLYYRHGLLYESTGIEGRSEIREVRPADGRILRRAPVPHGMFGEGATDWNGQIVSLTWRTGVGYRWDARTFRLLSSFRYPGEGWGLTRSENELVMSDGTSDIRFLDPATFAERRRIHVTFQGRPVPNLNELEWIDGQIWANVWTTDYIMRIDPRSGRVIGVVDIGAVSALQTNPDPNAVANGIAWDAKGRRLYVTGKNWRAIYEISVPSLNASRRGGR